MAGTAEKNVGRCVRQIPERSVVKLGEHHGGSGRGQRCHDADHDCIDMEQREHQQRAIRPCEAWSGGQRVVIAATFA